MRACLAQTRRVGAHLAVVSALGSWRQKDLEFTIILGPTGILMLGSMGYVRKEREEKLRAQLLGGLRRGPRSSDCD